MASKATCDTCNTEATITPSGRFRKHNRILASGNAVVCAGSGLLYASQATRAARAAKSKSKATDPRIGCPVCAHTVWVNEGRIIMHRVTKDGVRIVCPASGATPEDAQQYANNNAVAEAVAAVPVIGPLTAMRAMQHTTKDALPVIVWGQHTENAEALHAWLINNVPAGTLNELRRILKG